MDISARHLLALAALATAACAAPASAATFDHTATLTPDATTASWTGATANGLNTSFFLDGTAPGQKGTCGKDPNTMCESGLVHVVASGVSGGQLKFRLDGFQPYSDFDLRVYSADEQGAPDGAALTPKGDNQSTSPAGANDPRNTGAGDYETTTVDVSSLVDDAGDVDAYFLVRIPYFMVANDSYKLTATLSGLTPFSPTT
ncbi:MAG: hypothetical protein JWM71_1024 [Solirubrobacteraceae bacterium]|nr:hypothetical protein [Solirubrobacteraceae bacterium]